MNADDAIEFLIAGASAVAVITGLLSLIFPKSTLRSAIIKYPDQTFDTFLSNV